MSDSEAADLEEVGRPHNCGECRHWKHVSQSKAAGAKVLSPIRFGQCREGPPIVQQLPNGQQVIDYLPLPEQFPACDRFLLSLRVLPSG